MTTGGDQPSYAFDNAWVEARRRLTLLESVFDPFTFRALDSLGVKPGWRCLEVGAGAGSVARWLCSRVGESGRVVAVDLDTRFLEDLEEKNLEVIQQDIVADGLPGGGYDLIHARMLLIHLPTRRQVFESMVASLRPGGWLVVDDGDTFSVSALGHGIYAEVWEKMLVVFKAAGMHPTWGRELPTLFDRAGLEEIDVACDASYLQGGSTYAELFAVSFRQLHPRLLEVGATQALLDEVERLLKDPHQWFPGWGLFSVRGRAPAG